MVVLQVIYHAQVVNETTASREESVPCFLIHLKVRLDPLTVLLGHCFDPVWVFSDAQQQAIVHQIESFQQQKIILHRTQDGSPIIITEIHPHLPTIDFH